MNVNMTSPPNESQVPVLDIDPYSNEVIDNPHAFEHALREAGPVVWLKPYNMYAVGRFKEAEQAFSDDTRFWCTAGVGLTDIRKPESLRDKNPLMEVEPPQHAKVRAGMMKIMSPVAMRGMRARFDQKADKFVDAIVEKGSFDGLHDLVEPYIMDVFPQTVGININPKTVLLFGDLNFNANGPANDLYRAAYNNVKEYLPDFEKSFQRESMVPGGMGAQLYEAEDAGIFDKGTALGFVRVMFRGGFDTTIAGATAALYQLSQNPEEWAWLRENPDKAMLAFDEALRHNSPFRVSHRVTLADGCEFAGHKLAGDTKVAIFMGAANRDPRKWPEPDKYDLRRDDINAHLAFGNGAHKCIGLLLAKYESEALLKALAKRVKSIEFTGSEPPTYKRINTLRTVKDLPMRVTV